MTVGRTCSEYHTIMTGLIWLSQPYQRLDFRCVGGEGGVVVGIFSLGITR